MHHVFLEPMDASRPEPVLFLITPGNTFRAISKDLESQGILRYWWSIDVISRFRRVDKQIKAGEYALSRAMKPNEVLDALVSGKLYERKVTVKEGASVWEIGKLVEQAGLLTAQEFNAAIVDTGLLAQAGIPAEARSFEGYLFPETYSFSRGVTARQIIWTMLKQGEEKWNPSFTAQAESVNLTRHEILTLASIIEKESGPNLDEQPLISAVFHTRLREGMKLQADPTVIYGVPNFDGNLTREHLETDTPYNTYVRFGLPPGPIANPGLSAIKAALFPAQTPVRYFVSNGQGTHVFSETLEEHNRAVREFQQRR